jgi:integrase
MGCRIRRTAAGYLAYRLRSKLVPGYQSQERTGLRDTPTNRKRLEARALVITEEMRAGTFDYSQWFPRGSKTHLVQPAPSPVLSVRDYAEARWLPQKTPGLVRKSRLRDYRRHLRHILPFAGDVPLSDISVGLLERLRRRLREHGLAVKTIRNIVDATFRALYRDARREGLVTGDPFASLDWPRLQRRAPDPYTEEERNQLLDCFRSRKRQYYLFVLSAFWTGARPSELVGLRWNDVDLRAGKLLVRRSRTLGEDNAPKTAGSERTIEVAAFVIAALKAEQPLHARDDAFVFLNPQGRPIDVKVFTQWTWGPALRRLGLRPRKFYATRHTFISIALTRGWNLKALAEYTGTSVAMIERHYGRYIGGDMQTQLALLGGVAESPRPETQGDAVPISRAKAGKLRAVSGPGARRKTCDQALKMAAASGPFMDDAVAAVRGSNPSLSASRLPT